MSRSLALLPFEISRWAPEAAPFEEEAGASEEPSDSEFFEDSEASENLEPSENLESSKHGDENEALETSENMEQPEGAEALELAAIPDDELEMAPVDEGDAPDEWEIPEDGHAWLARADRVALGLWIREEMAALFASSRALRPVLLELTDEAADEAEALDDLELVLSPEPVAAAAIAAGAELGLACRLSADAEAVELSGLLADQAGEERVRFGLWAPLGEAHLLPRRAVRELLLALGEDAADAELPELDGSQAMAVEPEAVLDLCRGARSLADAQSAPAGSPLGDPGPALAELLEALAQAPQLWPARDLILRGAAREAGSASMPAWLAALEQLALLLPGDPRTLVALAGYRRLHLDNEGARELLLRARDLASTGGEEAQVLADLAALAQAEGRDEEAVQHLRAATRLEDDPALHFKLGLALRARDPQEAARSMQRAVVLDPEDPRARFELALQLQLLGETGRAATEAARAAQLAQEQPELSRAATELLRELIEAAKG